MAKDTMDGLIERKNKKGETIGLQLRITVGSKGGYIWLTKSVRYNRATCSPLKRRRTALFQSVL